MPRLLVITAAFGEGHNSAARNLALALEAAGAEVRVCDPCLLATPHSTKLLSAVYRYITTRFPRLWYQIYRSTDQCDFSRQRVPLMRKPERYLASLVEDYQPDAVVSTYPIYPYFLARTFEETGKKLPVFTVVTDSMEINASWLRAPSSYWLVTDAATRGTMIEKGLPAGQVVDTGFPVNPAFSRLVPVESDDLCAAFKVLYFPTGNRPFLRRQSRAILDADPKVKLTIVLGRNVRLLYSRAKEIKRAYPGRVRLVGWTRRVPQFLNSHHLVVGKAGGATVHEAIAARCPMLINLLVPGQEEGNLRLLEAIGGGCLADTPASLDARIKEILADNASVWRGMKADLIRHDRNAGALTAARFVLDHLSTPPRSLP